MYLKPIENLLEELPSLILSQHFLLRQVTLHISPITKLHEYVNILVALHRINEPNYVFVVAVPQNFYLCGDQFFQFGCLLHESFGYDFA